MISERDIAEKFSVIWKQNFPLLTPGFIKVFNDTQVKLINTNPIIATEEIRYDLVSETAFNITEIVISNNIQIEDYITNNLNLENIIQNTAKKIWKSGNFTTEEIKTTESEIQEIIKICNNLIEFITNENGKEIKFKPKLKGYGFIPDLEADLSIDDTLYEIKTVNRNFKSSDLKQLFIYLALSQVSKANKWQYAGLYNPRKGTYCKFNINSLIYNLTGGITPNEAFENLLDGLVRDIELDSRF
jgi:hypothetical protein